MTFDTPQEAFLAAVAMYCDGLDTVAVGCRGEQCEYADGDPEHRCEAGFSWAQCDSCGSTLGGDREPAVGLWKDSEGWHEVDMSICVDCVVFHANGDVPEEWQQSPPSTSYQIREQMEGGTR